MSFPKRAIVSVTNDLYTDQRVHKVCLFLEQQGYSVLLVGRKRRDSLPLAERSYKTRRLSLVFEKGALFYMEFNIRLFFFLLFKRSVFLVANDLDTLLANYTASKFNPLSTLVYDSHEYFTEVPELIHRPKIQKIWEGLEAWIFPKLKHIYTVNNSIAQLYRDKYKKEVQVVRNISPLWQGNTIKSKKELGIPEGKQLLILQGAGINIDRGAEEAVAAMAYLDDTVLLIVGDGDVIPELKKLVEQEKLDQKVLFYGKRPYEEMMQYTYYADLGLTLDKATNLNYRFSLPNKVFDYIQAGTPILATDLVEVKKIVEDFEVGQIIKELTPKVLADTIRSLLSDSDQLKTLKTNCNLAKEKLNWQAETEVLANIYPKIEK